MYIKHNQADHAKKIVKDENTASLLHFCLGSSTSLNKFYSNRMIYTCWKSKQDEHDKKAKQNVLLYESFSLWVLPYAVVVLYKICLVMETPCTQRIQKTSLLSCKKHTSKEKNIYAYTHINKEDLRKRASPDQVTCRIIY